MITVGINNGIKSANSTGTLITGEIKEAFKEAFDLILPFKCAVCGKVSDTESRFPDYSDLYGQLYDAGPELHICGQCLSSLVIQDEDHSWFYCLSNPVENDPCPGLALYLPFSYEGIVEKIIPKIKFGRQKELARLFGVILGSALQKEQFTADLVVPIPLSGHRLKERGFNQAGEIAYPVAKMNNLPYAEDCLIRKRDTGRQSEIRDIRLREANVTGAFAVNDAWDVTDLKVIVIDDVATTGSTLHEAALALYKAGASKVLCVAFAGNRQVKNAEPF